MTIGVQPLLLTALGRVPGLVPDFGPLIILATILIGAITLGPIIIAGVAGGVTGGLTQGASGGKGTLIGIGILTTVVCWVPIGTLAFLPELKNWYFWRDLVFYVVIPLTVLTGIVVTVVLVRRARL